MKNCVVAALMIGMAVGPASAFETGVGGHVGGIGLSAGVSGGRQGTSVGVGANVGGLGIGAGVSAGAQGTSVGVSTSVDGAGGANVGASVGAGLGVGVGISDDESAESQSAAAAGSPAAVSAATAKTTRKSMVLPPVLRPSKSGRGFTKGYPFGFLGPLEAIPGTPVAVVQACRSAVMSAAKPLGAIRVRAASAGALRQRRGAISAPINVRVDYARQGGIEVRQAKVNCSLDRAGRVSGIK
ncbi:hypothetical protein [Mesorhizobium caraganae]|uniref:hypothetical protein n=1 Tax=Mesorhizobium caraganae TaxID=483206 RepID=UPI0033356BB2